MAIFPTNPSMDGPNPDRPTTWTGFEQYTYQPMQTAQQFYVNGGYVQPQMPMYGQAESRRDAIPQYMGQPSVPAPTFGTPTYTPAPVQQPASFGFNQLVESRRDIPQIPNPSIPQNPWAVQSVAQPAPAPQYIGQPIQPVSFGTQPAQLGFVPNWNWPLDKKTSAWNDTTVYSPFAIPDVNWNTQPVAPQPMTYQQQPQYTQAFQQPSMQTDWLAYVQRNFPSAK